MKNLSFIKSFQIFSVCLIFILMCNWSFSQNYEWAKGIGSANADVGNSIAVDDLGNVYITGSFSDTVDFDPGVGIVNLIALDRDEIFFAKYDANGNYIWAKSVSCTGNDSGNDIAVDSLGNIYITGYFGDTADFDPSTGTANLTSVGLQDIFFAKYSPNGNYIWAKSMGSTDYNSSNSIAVDLSGNIYITGEFVDTVDFDPDTGIVNLISTSSSTDIFFAKYDANGNYLYAKNVGSAAYDACNSIAIDALGNVYITGRFNDTADFDPDIGTAIIISASKHDIFFAKYDANGNYLWAKSVSSTSFDYGKSIAVDVSGNTYITGYFSDTADFNPGAGTANLAAMGSYDIFFAKYDANGNYIWAKSFTSISQNSGSDITVDISGNIYITGYFGSTTDFDPDTGTANLTALGLFDIFFAKYDTNGNYIYAKKIVSTGNDYGKGIALDKSGNLYITGSFTDTADFDPDTGTAIIAVSSFYNDIFFAKYSTGSGCTIIGTIDGQVTTAAGDSTISGKAVCFQQSSTPGTWNTIATVSLDSTGLYSFVVDSGSYIIQVQPDTITYPDALTTYYASTFQWDSATVLTLGCGQSDTANIQLVELYNAGTGNGKIEGYVYNATTGKMLAATDPIPGLDILIKKIPPGSPVKKTITDNAGRYQFTDLSEGNYKVHIDIPGLPIIANYDVSITAIDTAFVGKNFWVDSMDAIYTTNPSSIWQSAVGSWQVSVFPNPFNETTTLLFNNPKQKVHELMVYDITGKVIKSYIDITDNKIVIDRKGMKQGMYFFRLRSKEGEQVYGKLMVD